MQPAAVGAACASTCGTTAGPASPRRRRACSASPRRRATGAGSLCAASARRAAAPRTCGLRRFALHTRAGGGRPPSRTQPLLEQLAPTCSRDPRPITALELAELAQLPRPQPCRPWIKYDISTTRFFIVKVLYVCIRQIGRNYFFIIVTDL